MNLVCTACRHVMLESEAIDDEVCPECYGDSLWETGQLTLQQITDAQFEAEALEAAEELEATSRHKAHAREFTDGLVSELRNIMGGRS